MYVLDTNTVSALMKGNEAVLARLEAVPRSAVSVPQPVLAEIAYGIQRLPKSKHKDGLRAKYELLRAELPRADWNDDVTAAFGRIKAVLERRGQRIEDFDAAIAAHAAGADAVLVTSNANHMSRIPGIKLEDWSQ